MKVEGGFLPLLAGLTAEAIPFLTGTVLPALGVGALSDLASSGVRKLVGNGLYIKKGGCVVVVMDFWLFLFCFAQRFSF